MKSKRNFVLGFILGAFIFGGMTAYAAGVIATQSSNRIFVDGKEVKVEAYMIENRNYLQLRDIAAAVDFSVVWDGANNRVLIDTSRGYDPNETMPTATPAPTETPKPTVSSRTLPKGVLDKDSCIWLDEDYQLLENEIEAIRLINEERANAGLSPVTINMDLCRLARIKAIEMVELDYLAHESPNYGVPKDMLKIFGISCNGVLENVSYTGGTEASGIVYNWMHSESHKKNVLSAKAVEVGIGVSPNGGGLGYWSLILTY